MSFIYDDQELLSKLIKLSQVAAPPAASEAPAGSLEVARQLIENLKTQLEQPEAVKFTADRDDANLNMTHLQNLDSLLSFLNFNKIKYNGLPLVISRGSSTTLVGGMVPGDVELNQLPEAQRKLYMPYPDALNPTHYLYKDGLVYYLKDLQSKGDNLLKTMTSKLIEELNFDMGSASTELKMTMQMHPDKAKTEPTAQPATQPTSSTEQINELQILNNIMGTLPFDVEDIDFDRIKEFFTLFTQLISGLRDEDKKSQIMQEINAANTAMANTLFDSNVPVGRFPMANLTPSLMASWLKQPSGQYAHGFWSNLLAVLDHTEHVVGRLYSIYYNRLSPAHKNAIAQQILGTNSKYLTNRRDLVDMEPHVKGR